MSAVAAILSSDGLPGTSIDESVDSLTSMIKATEIKKKSMPGRAAGTYTWNDGRRYNLRDRGVPPNKGTQDQNQPPVTEVGMSSNGMTDDRNELQGPPANSNAGGLGKSGPRGDSFKRQRRNRSKPQ